MDQPKEYNQIYYSSMETRNERFIPGSQILFHDASTTVGAAIRPPEANLSAGTKPVLNYSITGEEFSLEFMRERMNSGQLFIPNSSVGPGSAVGYMDIRSISGNSHPGFESGSTIYMVPSFELNNAKEEELEQKHSLSNEDRTCFLAAPSSQNLSKDDTNHRVSRYASWGISAHLSTKIKFLCSFAGKVLPRPSDGKLRYVGGETRFIQISKNILWEELMQKALSLYNEMRMIKYQLPGEDLDALVSVSCDEDIQNMIEECSLIENDGSHKPRMFLFSASDLENSQFDVMNWDVNSEIHYVIAVNGMDLTPSKKESILKSDAENALDELYSLKVDKGPSKNFAKCSEANSVDGQPIMMREQLDGKGTFYPSGHVQTADIPVDGSLTDKIPLPSIVKQADSCLSDKLLQGGCHLQELEASANEAMPRSDSYKQKVSDAEHIKLVGKEAHVLEVLEERSYRDNLCSKNSETEREQHLDNFCGAASLSCVDSTPKEIPVQELHGSDSKVGGRLPSTDTELRHPVQVPESTEVVSEGTNHQSNEKDVCGDVQANHIDTVTFPPEPPVLLQRGFHSEWIPREPADSNRLSKSDDSFDTQFVMSRLQTGLMHPITDITDDLCDGNMITETELPVSAAESFTSESNNLDNRKAKVSSMVIAVKDVERPDINCEEAESTCEIPISNQDMEILKCNDSENSCIGLTKGNGFCDRNQIGGQSEPLLSGGNETADVTSGKSSVRVEAPAQGDILIDINDRFPRDFLSEIFSLAKISQGLPGFRLLATDGTDMSMNIENHEPSHWSFFRNLAQNDFVRKDVPLVDDNHLVSSSQFAVDSEACMDHRFPSLRPDGFPQYSTHLGFDTVNQDPSGLSIATDLNMHSDLDISQVEDNIGLQFDAVSNTHGEDSKYEDRSGLGTLNVGDHSLRDFDFSNLQIIKNEDLEELQELGSGTFGTVYFGKWRGTDVAIKRIKKSCFIGRSSEQERLTIDFWREAAILSNLHHPNVVAFYGVVQDGPGSTLATVTEYMVNGSLRHVLLSKDTRLDYRKRLLIAMDAAFGMEYLHSKNIIHFDLKCDNLLVNLRDPFRPICKVGDFGLSKIKRNTLVTGGVRGTLPWMAPELLNGGSTKVSEKVDVFSFGIVLWEILTGEEPYANMHYGAIIGGIVNNVLRPPVPSSCDPEWRMLMEQCWAADAIARPSFTEIARRLRAMSAAAQSKLPH